MTRILRKSAYRIFLLSILIPVNALFMNAQKTSGFAGTWVIDHSRSDAAIKDYQITCNIKQTPQVMTVEQTFQTKDGQKTSMQPISYNLDGKEVTKEEQGGTDKISAKWSADKKSLTTRFVRTLNGSDFGSITTYTLSGDGKTLTVKSSDLTGNSQMVQVYKKQLSR